MINTPLIIKLGGLAIEDESAMKTFFGAVKQSKRPLVILHGGGALVDGLLSQLGFESQKRDGKRISPKEQMPYIVAALAGMANKKLQAYAKSANINSVGIGLSDGNLCQLEWRDLSLGCVGFPKAHDPKLLWSLLEQNYLPIISSIGLSEDGQLLNVNADDAAVAIAQLIDGQLVFLSDVEGVLDADGTLLPFLYQEQSEQLIAQGIIHGGMIAKVKAALTAASALGRKVEIASWQNSSSLSDLFEGKSIGTSLIVERACD